MRKSYFLTLIISLFARVFSAKFIVMGQQGHQITAEIANSLLSEQCQMSLQNCLGATTITEAATWMDEIKSDHQYDYIKSWHYINIEKSGEYDPASKYNSQLGLPLKKE